MGKVIEITEKELKKKIDSICFNLVSVREVISIDKYGSIDHMVNSCSKNSLMEIRDNIKNDYEKLKNNIPYILAYNDNVSKIHVEYPSNRDYMVPACYANCKKKIGDQGIIITAFGLGVSISHKFLNYLDGYKINLEKIYIECLPYGKMHPYYFLHDTRILKMLMNMYKKAVELMENIEDIIEERENKLIRIEIP